LYVISVIDRYCPEIILYVCHLCWIRVVFPIKKLFIKQLSLNVLVWIIVVFRLVFCIKYLNCSLILHCFRTKHLWFFHSSQEIPNCNIFNNVLMYLLLIQV
jgi:hypothetical protein